MTEDPLGAIRRAAAAGRLADALREAAALCDRRPEDADAARLYALLLTQGERPDALDAWRRVAALAPDDAEAHFQLGNAAGDRGDFAAAVAHLETARRTLPKHPLLLNNLALALEATGQLDLAVVRFGEAMAGDARAAIAVRPSLARALFRAGRHAEALVELDRLVATAERPDGAWLAARAVCLAELGRDDEAARAYRAALAHDRASAPLWHDFVRWLLARGRFDEADAVLGEARQALPDDTLVLGLLAVSRQRHAEWGDVPALRAELVTRVADPRWQGRASAYDFVALCDDPALQRRVAERYAATEQAPLAIPSWPRRAGDAAARLRLGFVASDYRDHPVGRLIVPLLERLDRGRFDVVAYATGRADDVIGGRIAAAGVDLKALPRRDPARAAAMLRADAIDVLFDLNGFSGGEALRIFAARPAPLQINFLGYTGTLGCAAYDGILTDRYCIAPQAAHDYVERPLYVDPCYLPSDPARATGAAPARADYALPDDGIVFHPGSALYKVTPEMFAAWLGLLRDVPGSVLWLRAAPASAQARMQAAAVAAGLDGMRLVIAPADPLERYLARLPLADIFLDTAPFGAHTTVNDALYMGVPAVTIAGRSFAGRASASQVVAAGTGTLACDDLPSYVATARALARDPARLRDCRAVLHGVRATPLFDAERYAAAFGEAIAAAWTQRP